MARQRRGGGKLPDVKGTLGTLLRSTIEQAGVVRDVLARGASEGRARIDDARANRRRADALAELGEIVLGLIRKGEIDPTEIPEVHDVLHALDELDGTPEDHAHGAHGHGHSHDDLEDRVTLPPSRSRFDDRVAVDRDRSRHPASTIPGRKRPDVDDTVSALGRAAPPRSERDPGATRVWRPTPIDTPHGEASPDAKTVAPPFRMPPSKAVARAPRKGGISFDDDEDADLGDYMHPDDVPPKPTDP